MSKLDLKAEMKPYIILDKEYGVSYVTSVGVSSGSLDIMAVHTKPKLYELYKDSRHYEIVFLEDAMNHPHFRELVKSLLKKEANLKWELDRTTKTIVAIDKALQSKG